MNDEDDEEVRNVARINVDNALARDPKGSNGRGAASRPTASSQSSQSRPNNRSTTEGPPVRLQMPVRKPGAGDGAPKEK